LSRLWEHLLHIGLSGQVSHSLLEKKKIKGNRIRKWHIISNSLSTPSSTQTNHWHSSSETLDRKRILRFLGCPVHPRPSPEAPLIERVYHLYPTVQLMIIANSAQVQWIRFFIWHAPFPVGSKNLDLSSHTHLCGFLKKRKPHGSDWRLFRQSILSLLWQQLVKHQKKKRMGLSGKQKVLKFYLSFLSTRVLELSWVEYYDTRCSQLNSTQPPVVLNSTQSNQVGSWILRGE
jgi:hypothetical protein